MYRATGVSSLLRPPGAFRTFTPTDKRTTRHVNRVCDVRRDLPSRGRVKMWTHQEQSTRNDACAPEHTSLHPLGGRGSSHRASDFGTSCRKASLLPSSELVRAFPSCAQSPAPARAIRKFRSRKTAAVQSPSPRRARSKRRNDKPAIERVEERSLKRKRELEPERADAPVHVDDKLLPFIFGQGWSPKKAAPLRTRGLVSTPLRDQGGTRSAFSFTPVRRKPAPLSFSAQPATDSPLHPPALDVERCSSASPVAEPGVWDSPRTVAGSEATQRFLPLPPVGIAWKDDVAAPDSADCTAADAGQEGPVRWSCEGVASGMALEAVPCPAVEEDHPPDSSPAKSMGSAHAQPADEGEGIDNEDERDSWICCDHCETWLRTNSDGIADVSVYNDSNPERLVYHCPECRKEREKVGSFAVEEVDEGAKVVNEIDEANETNGDRECNDVIEVKQARGGKKQPQPRRSKRLAKRNPTREPAKVASSVASKKRPTAKAGRPTADSKPNSKRRAREEPLVAKQNADEKKGPVRRSRRTRQNTRFYRC